MRTTVKAVYENGVFKPKQPVLLAEHAEVDVLIPSRPVRDPDDPTGWKAIRRLIGAGRAITPYASEKRDEFLYGDPHD